MASILLKKEMRKGELWCLLGAQVVRGRLTITRIDFQEWEYNQRSGQVEVSYYFDEANTDRMMELIEEHNPVKFLRKLKAKFRKRCGISMTWEIREYCKEHGITYEYFVWY